VYLFCLLICIFQFFTLVDGLKPGQRKVLFACFKRNLREEIKVAQLSGYVAEKTGKKNDFEK
jgi:DNA topoisomerase-2